VLVPGRTEKQCRDRWKDVLAPNIDLATQCMAKWSKDEDIKLKDAVQRYGGKNWAAIAALVQGRTKKQCQNRWYRVLDPDIHRANEPAGKWSEDEDIKLKDAVQTHCGKNWSAIAALVPDRTKLQCHKRWNDYLHPRINLANRRMGKWTEDEDIKLKDAVQTHSGKNWGAIAALVPGRTKIQCYCRWQSLRRSTN
jgi:hypothetical protein